MADNGKANEQVMVATTAGGWRQSLGLAILAVLYLLANVRWFPGRAVESLSATALHLIQSAPFILGLTIFVVSLLQRVAKQTMAWPRRIRLFLFFGLLYEFLFALHHYLGSN